MATFTLTAVDRKAQNEEAFHFVCEAGRFVEFLVLYPMGADNRSYTLKDSNAPQAVVDKLQEQFETVMRYTEFHRDPEVGFKLEVQA